LIKRVLSNI
jgi:WD40 repeat protein